jgi:hypothetical protein
MAQRLARLAGGRVVAVLEGGYNTKCARRPWGGVGLGRCPLGSLLLARALARSAPTVCAEAAAPRAANPPPSCPRRQVAASSCEVVRVLQGGAPAKMEGPYADTLNKTLGAALKATEEAVAPFWCAPPPPPCAP